MNEAMARRLDPALPAAGGLMHLREVKKNLKLFSGENGESRVPDTFLHPVEAEHLNKAFTLLGDDLAAKSTLMTFIAFAQMKNDCAG